MDPKTIVVVDDEPRICTTFEKALAKQGHKVETFTDAQKSLERIKQGGVDLVVSDMMMPEMTGVELLNEMNAAGIDTPMVMITGYATVDNAMETMRLGAVDYLPKPFTIEELRGVVGRGLRAGDIKPDELPAPPSGTYIVRYHSWARPIDDNEALIGVHPFLLSCCGRIIGVELPQEEDDLMQGGACGKLLPANCKAALRLWSPLSGDVLELNPLIATTPHILNDDPYGEGWLMKIRPSDLEEELRGLSKA